MLSPRQPRSRVPRGVRPPEALALLDLGDLLHDAVGVWVLLGDLLHQRHRGGRFEKAEGPTLQT